MPPVATLAALSKSGLIIDLIQLAIGSTIGRVIVGIVVAGFVLLYIAGKIFNAQDERRAAQSQGDQNSPPSSEGGVRLDK